jgi:hypothetical protein
MARSTWPMKEEIRMSEKDEDIAKITQDLLNAQKKLLDYHKNELKGLDCWMS